MDLPGPLVIEKTQIALSLKESECKGMVGKAFYGKSQYNAFYAYIYMILMFFLDLF